MMCASTVQVAAPPGEVVSNTGKQNRKVLATPVMESFASITGVTTLLRQKHGNRPPPPIFLHSIPFSFVRRSNYRLPLIPSSDGSHACAAEMVRYREERNYEPYAAAVRYILTNEKYTGDSLWQKTYTSHTLPATRYKNTGEYEQFYAMGTHPPIISKEAFEQAQQLAQKRKSTYGKKLRREPYPLSQKISCGHCGSSYRRKEQVSSAYWCCRKHDTSVKDCPIAPVAEESLYGAFCRLYYKLKHQSIPILEQMLTNLQLIHNRRMLWSPDIVALNKRISDLSSQNQTLAFLKQQGLVDPDIFIAKTNELTKQLRQAKLEKEKLMDAESDMTALQTRDLIDLLEGGPEFLDSFDAELFGELVEKIIIESNDSVRFCLKNGLELRESIERTVR